MITRRRRRTEPPRRATWTFAVYYMRDKGQTLWLLSSMTEFALENVMAMVRSDMPCIGCAEPYDLADRITPHAVIFAVHPAGHSWTASLCRSCVEECGGDRKAVLRLAVDKFKAQTGASLDPATLRMREKEAVDATTEILAKLKRGR